MQKVPYFRRGYHAYVNQGEVFPHRWWDLKRWHASGDIDLTGWDGSEDNFSTNLASPVQFDVNKHLVFPLPQEEVERNSAITENNPGY